MLNATARVSGNFDPRNRTHVQENNKRRRHPVVRMGPYTRRKQLWKCPTARSISVFQRAGVAEPTPYGAGSCLRSSSWGLYHLRPFRSCTGINTDQLSSIVGNHEIGFGELAARERIY